MLYCGDVAFLLGYLHAWAVCGLFCGVCLRVLSVLGVEFLSFWGACCSGGFAFWCFVGLV